MEEQCPCLPERELQFDGELTAEQRARLLDIAERCPVHRTLHSEVLVSTTRPFWAGRAADGSGSRGWIMDAPASSVAGMTAPAVESDPALKPRRVTRG